jgi:four helix bundle protein
MSNIRSFRELKVWQRGMDAAMEVFRQSKRIPSEERYSLTDQVRRSSRSVPANIAEAWRKRRYPAAFVSKLNDAEAEAAETQTHIEIALRCGYLSDETAKALDACYEEILSMLVTMINQPEKWSISQSPSPSVSQSQSPRVSTSAKKECQ